MRIPVKRIFRIKPPAPRPSSITISPNDSLSPATETGPSDAGAKTRKTAAHVFFTGPSIDRHILNVHIHAHGRTDDPTWILVNRLTRYDRRLAFVDALGRQNIPVDEFRRKWAKIACAQDAEEALTELEKRRATRQVPSWLLLHIASHLVKTPVHAAQVMNVVLFRAKNVEPAIAPWMLVIVAHTLARLQMLAHLRRLIDAFSHLSVPTNALHFNHLLLAAARLPASVESARAIARILQTMSARQHKLHGRTHAVLLSNRMLILELSKLMHDQMVMRGAHLDGTQLEDFIRLFAPNGAIHDPGRYSAEVRAARASSSLSNTTERTNAETDHTAVAQSSKIDNNDSSHHGYLNNLIGILTHTKFFRRNVAEKEVTPPRPRFMRQRKRRNDVHDQIMRLVHAARDVRHTSSEGLLARFAGLHPRAMNSITISTVLHGFLRRHEYAAAIELWNRLESSGMRIVGGALNVAVRVLAGGWQYERAFNLLERYHKLGNPDPLGTAGSSIVSVQTVNAFSQGLIRAHRPDIVLLLWDGMKQLYNVYPDRQSLGLMLRAASLVGPLADSTVRGAMAQLGASLPFRTPFLSQPTLAFTSRATVCASIVKATARREVQNGLWHGVPAAEAAARVFRQVVIGNAPELLNAQAPARALRQSPDDAALRPLSELRTVVMGTSRAETSSTSTSNVRDVQALAAQGLYPPPFPYLSPDNKIFRLYFTLLGLSGQAPSIALGLSWMRALGVRPSFKTLAIALIFWGEVSMAAPWLEARAQRAATSQYARLLQWLQDWVGKVGMPKDVHMKGVVQWLKRKRERRT